MISDGSPYRLLQLIIPLSRREVDDLLGKGAFEPSTGGAGFYSNIFVVPKHTGGLWSLLNLKLFNHYITCLLSDRYSNLFNRVNMFLLLISRILIYISLLLSITIAFSILFGHSNLISERFCHLGWLWPLRFPPHSLNQYCSIAITRVFMLLFIWMISWSLLALSMLERELKPFCAVYWFVLDYILIFPSLNFVSYSNFLFGGEWVWDILDMPVSLLSENLLKIQKLAHAFLQRQPVALHQCMSFLGKATFCVNGHAQLCQLCHVIQSDILNIHHSLSHLFLSFHLSLPVQCHVQRSQLQQRLVPLQYPLPALVIATDAMTHHWAF